MQWQTRMFDCGPSPHAWGEPAVPGRRIGRLRTIPTRVGRTTAETFSCRLLTDHPHTRGENMDRPSAAIEVSGPSPHAWGELTRNQAASKTRRTIPTRVGRTGSAVLPGSGMTDHPHTRGENAALNGTASTPVGPSPHAWGEPVGAQRDLPLVRTIPTRVGRTHLRGGC